MHIENFSRVAELIHRRDNLTKVLNEPVTTDRILNLIGLPILVLESSLADKLKRRLVDAILHVVSNEVRELIGVIDAELVELGMSID